MTAVRALRSDARTARMSPISGVRAAARIAPPPHRTHALAAAVETMMRGAAFLRSRAAMLEQDGVSSPTHRTAVLANSLRELDRFLNILLDELAAKSGMSGQALRGFRRRRSAIAKLSAHPALFGHRIDDRSRLLALAAQQAALLDHRLASGSRSNARLIVGRAVETWPPSTDIQAITTYYMALAERIIRHVELVRIDRQDARRRMPGLPTRLR